MRKWNMEELGRKSVEAFKQAGKTPVVLVLDNIRSMHNVGSIFRSADAFLIEAIFLCGYTPQPPHRAHLANLNEAPASASANKKSKACSVM